LVDIHAEVVILPIADHECMGCFTDQLKLTHALVRDLDEAIKEVKLLEEHEEKSSQKITELEAKGRYSDVEGREGHP
jgi:hypothetical protein